MYQEASPSPSGEFILINKIKRPFSYSVPYRLFGHTFEVWDNQGNLIKVIADLPVADEVPRNGVPVGPRALSWQPLKPATLTWVEALDGGDPEKSVPARERLMLLEAPLARRQ